MVDQHVAVAPVGVDSSGGGGVVTESGQRGDLGELRNVSDGAPQLFTGTAYYFIRSEQPADAPAGHGVDLGDTVDDDDAGSGLGSDGQRGDGRAGVDEGVVDFVADQPDVVVQAPLGDAGPADRVRALRLLGWLGWPGWSERV